VLRFAGIIELSISRFATAVRIRLRNIKMKIVLVLTILKLASVSSAVDDFMEFVQSFDYKSEAHEVETQDGYLLTVHRILPNAEPTKKIPVLLMHGLMATSGDYVVLGKQRALGFLLADNGYDVWLGNARGNKYSTNHRNLSTDSPEFWDFSWHEIGFYDLPATIDYMLNTTNASKALYVGHSQGTTSIMVLLSTRPEYNEKIIQAHLMSPVIFVENLPHVHGRIFKSEIENGIFDDFSFLNLASFWNLCVKYRDNFCYDDKKEFNCPGLLFLIFYFLGANKKRIEMDTVSVI
jgi:predicted alpha/beta-fold hydrolase